jgi:tRNA(fMet)-specific endonuclease VapC
LDAPARVVEASQEDATILIVLDTSAISAVMHRIPSALERLRAFVPDNVVLASPVAAELRYGLERLPRSRRRRLLETEYQRLRDVLRWEDWNEAAAVEFGRQKARLDKLGIIIEDFDIAIGSIAIALGATLATSNAKHLGRLERVALDDWAA